MCVWRVAVAASGVLDDQVLTQPRYGAAAKSGESCGGHALRESAK